MSVSQNGAPEAANPSNSGGAPPTDPVLIAFLGGGYSWAELYYDPEKKGFYKETYHCGSVDDADTFYDGAVSLTPGEALDEVYSSDKAVRDRVLRILKEFGENCGELICASFQKWRKSYLDNMRPYYDGERRKTLVGIAEATIEYHDGVGTVVSAKKGQTSTKYPRLIQQMFEKNMQSIQKSCQQRGKAEFLRRTVPGIGSYQVTYDPLLKEERVRIQLDAQRLYFLSVFYQETPLVGFPNMKRLQFLKYSLDVEAAEDSHCEFDLKGEYQLRTALADGDERKNLYQIFADCILEKGGSYLVDQVEKVANTRYSGIE